MNKDTIRLTPKQKEVIEEMQKREHVFGWDHTYAKFTFKGKSFRYDLGKGLQILNLIERNPLSKPYRDYSFTLTTIGRTIKL